MPSTPRYMRDEYWPVAEDEVFARPNWVEIGKAIEEMPEGERAEAWVFARERWVCGTMLVLNGMLEVSGTQGKSYNIGRSAHFTIVSPYRQDRAEELPTLGENFRRMAQQVLGEKIARDPPMGHIIFILHNPHVMQEYLRPYQTNAFHMAGVCLHKDVPHILIHDMKWFRLRMVFIHELNHSLLYGLTIPNWVHEGLSRYFESRLLTIANMYFGAERNVGQNKFWKTYGLRDFWNGRVFYDRRAPIGYVLAHRIILRLMKVDEEAFEGFMLTARREDAGDAACREFYGKGILEMARDLLGVGEWEGPANGDE